jgi:hypothetical protein
MPKCSNCQRETQRTIDWACYLCGYPLTSKDYNKIDKTYKQIREDRLHKKNAYSRDLEEAVEIHSEENIKKGGFQDIPLLNHRIIDEEHDTVERKYREPEEAVEKHNERKLEFEREIQKIQSFNPQYKTQPTDDYKQDIIEEGEETEIPPAFDEKSFQKETPLVKEESCFFETTPESPAIAETINYEEPLSKPLPESNPELVEQGEQTETEIKNKITGTDSTPETVNTIESVPVEEQEVIQSTPVLPPVDLELTIEVLLSEYASNYVEANTKFVNKIIKLTGIAAAIDIKEVLAVHYIRMTDSAMDVMQSVQCIFDKKYAEVLRGIQKGQTITVQGKYTGSLIAMRMADCVVV